MGYNTDVEKREHVYEYFNIRFNGTQSKYYHGMFSS